MYIHIHTPLISLLLITNQEATTAQPTILWQTLLASCLLNA